MTCKRIYVLLGVLIVAIVFSFATHRLPWLINAPAASSEKNSFAEVVLREAAAGDPHAQYLLALQYQSGLGRTQDPAEAFGWLTKAAESGYPNAEFDLAGRFEEGASNRGDDDDTLKEGSAETVKWYLVEALKWYRRAAEHGLAVAEYKLGLLLRFDSNRSKGTNGFPRAVLSAEYRDWWRRAAEQGDVEAAYDLAFDCDQTEEYVQAAKWYKVAADRGSLSALSHLAELYFHGNGVPQDRGEAIKLALRVADGADLGGDSNLYFRLGKWYAAEGPLQDVLEAYKWFNIVASKGHFFAEEAKERRDRLQRLMSPEQIAEGERRATEFVRHWERSNGDATERTEQGPTLDVHVTGSGFFITEEGHFCTSFHVVQNANRIMIRTGGRSWLAKLVSRDMANDLTILKIDGNFGAIPVAPSRTVRLGESVLTVGFPNLQIQGFEPKLTRGEISSLAGMQDDPRYFQISVPVQPGNSGGALLDSRGNAVGIVAMQMDDTKALKVTGSVPQNVNYAVKSSLLLSLIESVPGLHAKLKRPFSPGTRRYEDVVQDAEHAAGIVLVY